jgi:GGDEF domain-containing protein
MTAARAERVCAFMNTAARDGRMQHALHAEAVVSEEWSLRGAGAAGPEDYDALVPGLFERLAAGEPFTSRTEFMPGRAARRLAEQGVEATLLLPLFVGGDFRGFLRLDRCDRGRLWDDVDIGILVSAAGSVSAAIDRQAVVAQLVQRSHELAALLATSRSITSSIDYDVVLREVASAAAGALGSSGCVIWEYSGRSDMATYRVLYEREPRPGAADDLLGTKYYASEYPGGMHAVRKGIVAQQSISDSDLSAADRARMTERREQTWLSVPLVYGEDVLGMMILTESERERRFTPDEVRMAKVIGEQAAAALHNARLHRREEDQHRWLAALAEATRVIASQLDPAELLQDVARLAADALLVDRVVIYEADGRRGFTACTGGDLAAAGSRSPEPVDATVGAALHDGEVVVRRRDELLTSSPGIAARMAAAGEHTVVWVPFRMKDETLGAMRLADGTRTSRFEEGELSFARALGEHAAIALNNARLYRQIEDQAMRDGLCGLANHRCFYDRLSDEIDRAQRYGTPVCLLMLDIDDFKKLNDTYGHPAGDEVLRLIGRLMTEELRRGSDLAARYGGEEFCVILPNTPALWGAPAAAAVGQPEAGHPEGGVALAERLRRRIAAARFPVGPGETPVSVTVSIGVAAFPAAADDMDGLVARADAALYAAKRAGKDNVQVC